MEEKRITEKRIFEETDGREKNVKLITRKAQLINWDKIIRRIILSKNLGHALHQKVYLHRAVMLVYYNSKSYSLVVAGSYHF